MLPAVTCTAQATLLTGKMPNEHGVVANGWLFRDTNEVRFWQQSNRLIQAEPLYATARTARRNAAQTFTSAKLFWWFNQGAAVDISRDAEAALRGRWQQGIRHHRPRRSSVADALVQELGAFPFPAFWGPMAGAKSTQWIANAAASTRSSTTGPTSHSFTCRTSTTTRSDSGRRAATWPSA